MNFSLQNLSFREIGKFQVALQEGDLEVQFNTINKAASDWGNKPYNSLYDAPAREGLETVGEFIRYFSRVVEGMDSSEVAVDIDAWSIERLLKFNRMVQQNKFDVQEDMLKEVALMDGVTDDKPLTAYQGIALKVAVMQYCNKVMTGKN